MFRSRWTTTSRCKEASELSMEPSFLHPRNATFGSFWILFCGAISYLFQEGNPSHQRFRLDSPRKCRTKADSVYEPRSSRSSDRIEMFRGLGAQWSPIGTQGPDDSDHFQGEQRFRDLDSCRISNQWISATIKDIALVNWKKTEKQHENHLCLAAHPKATVTKLRFQVSDKLLNLCSRSVTVSTSKSSLPSTLMFFVSCLPGKKEKQLKLLGCHSSWKMVDNRLYLQIGSFHGQKMNNHQIQAYPVFRQIQLVGPLTKSYPQFTI